MYAMKQKDRDISRWDFISLDCNSSAGLQSYFEDSWNLNEWLFSAMLSPDGFFLRPDSLRHPLVFYLGHTAAFYVNKFRLAGLIEKGINEKYEVLFAQGIDPDSPDALEKETINWPTLEEVTNYRSEVYNLVTKVIHSLDLSSQVTPDHSVWALHMGMEHDRIHFETSSVLIRQLPLRYLKQPSGWRYASDTKEPVRSEFIEIQSDKVKIGKTNLNLFGWDNEYGEIFTHVNAFYANRGLTSNKEFLDFVKDGGYQRVLLWSKAGNLWRTSSQAKHPKFWIPTENSFGYRAMFDILPFPDNWPVEVNYFEAEAYCRWKGEGARLMTEPEYRLFASEEVSRVNSVLSFNNNLKNGSPTSVNHPDFMDERGIYDVYGNVWQWISTPFYPLPGFQAHPYYLDFSTPYFNEDHFMMLGGSWATTGASALRNYRLWFRKKFFQHAGFRVVKSAL